MEIFKGNPEKKLVQYCAQGNLSKISETLRKNKNIDMNIILDDGHAHKWERSVFSALLSNKRCEKVKQRVLNNLVDFVCPRNWPEIVLGIVQLPSAKEHSYYTARTCLRASIRNLNTFTSVVSYLASVMDKPSFEATFTYLLKDAIADEHVEALAWLTTNELFSVDKTIKFMAWAPERSKKTIDALFMDKRLRASFSPNYDDMIDITNTNLLERLAPLCDHDTAQALFDVYMSAGEGSFPLLQCILRNHPTLDTTASLPLLDANRFSLGTSMKLAIQLLELPQSKMYSLGKCFRDFDYLMENRLIRRNLVLNVFNDYLAGRLAHWIPFLRRSRFQLVKDLNAALKFGNMHMVIEVVCRNVSEMKAIPELFSRKANSREIEIHTERALALMKQLQVFPKVLVWLQEVTGFAVLSSKFEALGIQDALPLVAQAMHL